MTAPAPRFAPLDELIGSIRQIVEGGGRIACLAHKDADADSLGSSLGFALSLLEMGKNVVAVVPEPMPMLLAYLPGYELVETAVPEFDALFTFDCASVGRFGEKRTMIESGRPVVNVDHHLSNEGFGSINLVDATASATGQVVHALLCELGAPITPAVANNLYAALFTDTGGFRHENTNEEALRLGATLVAHGADAGWIARKSYQSRPLAQVRLEALAVGRMHTEAGARLIWSEVTQDMLRETTADMQMSEGVIDQLQSIDTMQIAVLFKESADGLTKVSVRTRDQYDATALCTPFRGGGHYRAAGAEIRAGLADAREQVLTIARQLLERP